MDVPSNSLLTTRCYFSDKRLHSGAQGRRFDLSAIEYLPAMLLGSSCGMAFVKWLNDRQFALSVNLLLVVSGLSFLL